MATQAEIDAHRESVNDAATLAVAALVSQWADLPLDDPEAMREVLADLLAELVDEYGSLAAVLGVDWYEALRVEAQVVEAFTPMMPPLAPLAQIENLASYAASALYVDADKALADMAGITDRMVKQAERNAIEVNAERDPARVRWARSAQAGACAFCALLATRGGVYRTEDNATGYHDHCSCVPVPVWNDQPWDLPDYAEAWVDAYDTARQQVQPGASLSALLAVMRDVGGLR